MAAAAAAASAPGREEGSGGSGGGGGRREEGGGKEGEAAGTAAAAAWGGGRGRSELGRARRRYCVWAPEPGHRRGCPRWGEGAGVGRSLRMPQREPSYQRPLKGETAQGRDVLTGRPPI